MCSLGFKPAHAPTGADGTPDSLRITFPVEKLRTSCDLSLLLKPWSFTVIHHLYRPPALGLRLLLA
jgi:hypothetical protein